MVKVLVALLASLLVLAGPAAAQDPPSDGSGSDPPSEPPESPPPQDDGAGGDGAGDEPSEPDGGSQGQADRARRSVECRVAKSSVLNPNSQPGEWLVLDPDHCIRQTVDRLIGNPFFLLRR